MRMIDHGIMGGMEYCGALRSMIAVFMDDDCIQRCWRENVPVVGEDSLQVVKSRYIAALPQREWRDFKRANSRQREGRTKKIKGPI